MKYENSKGIDRQNMPQIAAENVPGFLDWCTTNGVGFIKERVKVKTLLPTQSEYNEEKVEKMRSAPYSVLSKPIVVSDDNYILDGHHRYSALLANDGDNLIEIYRVRCDIVDLLIAAHKFPLTFYKGLKESRKKFSDFI
ncbi:hypothetical protein [Aeromonas phage AS-zj]|uniref:ParB/Sulfiredoxin domain-containing protein n=5 Tax=Caudoviricetes TaxID=2731619 RepID=A0A291LDG4_9CAUD|nr:hypothetical protein HWB28_gp328 [Aeromonas phage AS-zj]YP_009834861.1 hypothetical protein HWB29_gp159 [Aeromonas phage AS-sw]ATI17370.1 hypothetical protein [Aeromonas phage AS-szw]QAX97811.1 hypothetical protein ASswx1_167 [Aeromonas phage Asswx_1]QAX99135.1 hypothetical protein assk_350 [Aeromonas phage Assk]ASU00224.1 hypothetical protein [Aeromonas phage AS-zj]ATI18209.1 hypothetical protein [Aeromonas phage AS-sw]